MNTALALVVGLSIAGESEALVVSERTPLAVALVVPSGKRGPVSSTELLESLDRLVREATDFRLVSVGEEEAIRSLMMGADPTVRLCEKATAIAPGSPFLLQLQYVTSHESGAASATLEPVLIDLSVVAKLMADPGLDIERAIYRAAIPESFRSGVRAGDAVLSSRAEVEASLSRLVSQTLRPSFGAHWAAFSEVTLTTPEPGMVIIVDGNKVGETAEGATKLTQVPRGARIISLEHPAYPRLDGRLTVTSSSPTSIALMPVSHAASTNRTLHGVTLWTGVVTAAAGMGFAIAGAMQAEPTLACVGAPSCGASSWTTLGEGNPPLTPLGYSLIADGASMATTSALTDNDELP